MQQRFSLPSGLTRVFFLGTAFLIAGCAAKLPAEERLMKQRIETLEKMIAEFEKVIDKSSMDQAWPALKELSAKLTEQNEEFKALPEELKDRANASALAQKMQEVTARLTTAKAKA